LGEGRKGPLQWDVNTSKHKSLEKKKRSKTVPEGRIWCPGQTGRRGGRTSFKSLLPKKCRNNLLKTQNSVNSTKGPAAREHGGRKKSARSRSPGQVASHFKNQKGKLGGGGRKVHRFTPENSTKVGCWKGGSKKALGGKKRSRKGGAMEKKGLDFR